MKKLQSAEETTAETKPTETATDTPVVQADTAPIAPAAQHERPTRGGAFIRQPDGTIVPEAEADKEA